MSHVYVSIDGETIPIPYGTAINSHLIKSMLDDIEESIIILIPDRFRSVFDNYRDFLFGIKLFIDNDNVILNCFKLANYLQDDVYFEYVLTQMFDNWSDMSYIINGDNISSQLRYDIVLHIPYDWLPKSYLDDDIFVAQWLELNQNKNVIIDGNKIYHINEIVHTNPKSNDPQGVNLISYHTTDNDVYHQYTIQYDRYCQTKRNVYSYIWCKDALRVEKQLPPLINLMVNGVKQGIWYEQHRGVKITGRGVYSDGKKQGLWEQWFDNGQLQFKGYYDFGLEIGTRETFNMDGTLRDTIVHENVTDHGHHVIVDNKYTLR